MSSYAPEPNGTARVRSSDRPQGSEPITELAAEWGIDPEYVDGFGRRCALDREALRAILDALGPGPPSRRKLLPRVVVARQGRQTRVALPGVPSPATIRWTIMAGSAPIADGAWDGADRVLPEDLPLGTLRLSVTVGSDRGEDRDETTLLVAP